MVARAIWSGVLTFGMVSIPIKMFTATENKDISFNQLHSPCKSRIKEQKFCPTCDRKIESEEIEKGYAYAKDQYVVVSKEDLEHIPLPSKGAIEISAFVKLDQIDPVQYEKSYYIEPDDIAKKPFTLFMRAMSEKGMVAVAKVAIRNKERLCCLRPLDGTLMMSTLLYPDEIRVERGKELPNVAISDKELAMAGSLIDLMSEDFDPSKYKDDYREALVEVIEAKLAGKEVVTTEAPPQSNVLELMDALRASMENIKSKKTASGGAVKAVAAKTASAGKVASAKPKKRSAPPAASGSRTSKPSNSLVFPRPIPRFLQERLKLLQPRQISSTVVCWGGRLMWNLAVPWWELVLRAVVIYTFLLTILRVTGKRQVGQLAPFDLVLLLVLSNAVQNAMTGPDNSVGGGIIICTTLIAVNTAIGYATYRSKAIESLIEGRPQVLIHNGKLDERVMRKEKITHHELMASLRAAGCAAATEVHFAILENNGHISVQPRKMNGDHHPNGSTNHVNHEKKQEPEQNA